MAYLTTAEFSNKWNISNRMIAYYCANGRIQGALKKGKTWLIPADASKPLDKRYSNRKVTIDDNADFINESDTMDLYQVNDIYNIFNLIRDTLRYYEKIALINPKRNKDSKYREFSFYDIAHLLAIDFYKKRGFSAIEIKELMSLRILEEYNQVIANQVTNLKDKIIKMQAMLEKLEDTYNYSKNYPSQLGTFSIRELPLYYVQEMFDNVANFKVYEEKVLSNLNLDEEDIISNMIRILTFDKTGYKGSKICIVKKSNNEAKQRLNKLSLEGGKCLYTVIEGDNNDESILDQMFIKCHEWANNNNISLRGLAYVFIRFMMINEVNERNFYEIWLPIK